MSIEIVLEGQLETEKDFEGYLRLLKELCDTWKLKMETYENFALIDVCPEGFVEVSYKDTFLSISAQTNVAGPGFHAYVCEFFHAIQEKSPIALNVSDPTNYIVTRNFEQLKHGVFYRWLQDIASYVKENHQDVENLCLSWPMDYYQPKAKAGHLVTPMGYISIQDFTTQDMDTLAKRFFVWNNLGRDGEYYRSAAFNLLWKECFFEYTNINEYTEKQANLILDYLELAHEKDPELPLPMDAYDFLCEVSGRHPNIEHAKRMISLQEIGYRKDVVEFHFGNWSIPAHGCAEKSVDESTQTLYLMAPYRSAEEPWRWMYKVNIFAFKQEVETFLPEIMDGSDAFTFTKENVKGMGSFIENEDHLLMNVQLNCGKEMMFVQVVVCHREDLKELQTWIKQIKYRKIQGNEVRA